MLTTLFRDKRFRELQRFAVVGVATFFLNLSLFYSLVNFLQLDYRHAVSYAYVITVLCHFAANKSFTFGARQQPLGRNATRYAVMLVVNYCVTLAVSWLVIGWWGLPGYVAVLCYTAANATTSFLLMKHIVFQASSGRSAEGMR